MKIKRAFLYHTKVQNLWNTGIYKGLLMEILMAAIHPNIFLIGNTYINYIIISYQGILLKLQVYGMSKMFNMKQMIF